MTRLTNRAISKRISQFSELDTISNTDFITTIRDGINYKVSFPAVKQSLGVSGEITSTGDPLGTPVLEVCQDNDYKIRNLEPERGITTGLSPQNGIKIGTDLVNGADGIPIIPDVSAKQILLRSLAAGAGIGLGVTDDRIIISVEATGTNVVVVNSPSDFPDPVGGVITLQPGVVYQISSALIDISPNRIFMQDGASLRGLSPLNNVLFSDTTGPLISGTTRLDLSNFVADVPNGSILDYNSPTPKTGTVLIERVVARRCQSVARVRNYETLFITGTNVEDAIAGNVTFEGQCKYTFIDTALVIGNSIIFDLGASTHEVIEAENITIEPLLPTTIVLDGLPNSGNIEPGGIGVLRAVNVIGPFTQSGNISNKDVRWNFTNSNVFQNSRDATYIAMPDNVLETDITLADTPVKVNGVFDDVDSSRFTNDTTGRATYIGERNISIQANVSFTHQKTGGGGTDTHTYYLAVNGVVDSKSRVRVSTDGSRDPALSIVSILNLTPNDFVELYVEGNGTTDNVTVTSFNMVLSN